MSNENKKDSKGKMVPLEEFFETEPTHPISPQDIEDEMSYTIERVESELFDNKDNEIEQHFQRLYDLAMEGYETIMTELDGAPPEQVHKLATAAQKYLTSALDASKQKAAMKSHKDKIEHSNKKSERSLQGDAVKVMADRNELLKQMLKDDDAKNKKTP